MTYERCLYHVFSSPDYPAYAEGTEPVRCAFPYLTYSLAAGNYGEGVPVRVRFYDRSPSFSSCDTFFSRMEELVPSDGVLVPFERGAVWLTRGNIFLSRKDIPADRSVRCAEAEVTAAFLR